MSRLKERKGGGGGGGRIPGSWSASRLKLLEVRRRLLGKDTANAWEEKKKRGRRGSSFFTRDQQQKSCAAPLPRN